MPHRISVKALIAKDVSVTMRHGLGVENISDAVTLKQH